MDTNEIAKKMLEANRIYYSYPRLHSALSGQMPVEKAGIDLKLVGGNKYEQLISRASRSQKPRNNSKVISEKKRDLIIQKIIRKPGTINLRT
jgi:hypothetical protein